jgi:hypothetical protein
MTSTASAKVIETVREKFSCRDCEKISQAPAPFHAVARGWAGPSLLAMIMFEKFGQHQPLNRQADRYALEAVPIALSTMADAVGSVCTALDPLLRLLEAHVILVVMQLLSGGATPMESMPVWLQHVMRIVSPTPHFVAFSQAVLYRSIVWPRLVAMAVIDSVYFAFSLHRFRRVIFGD